MTPRVAAHHITTWRDWIVLVGLAINLLAVGSMYGSIKATLSRAVADVQRLDTRVDGEASERRSEDSRLRDEMSRADKWLDDRVIELCGGK